MWPPYYAWLCRRRWVTPPLHCRATTIVSNCSLLCCGAIAVVPKQGTTIITVCNLHAVCGSSARVQCFPFPSDSFPRDPKDCRSSVATPFHDILQLQHQRLASAHSSNTTLLLLAMLSATATFTVFRRLATVSRVVVYHLQKPCRMQQHRLCSARCNHHHIARPYAIIGLDQQPWSCVFVYENK